MDSLVEKEINQCISCQATMRPKYPPPTQSMPIPETVWDKLNVDYLGPFPNGQYIFVAIDQRSKFPEIEFVSSTSANQQILALERIFSVYGVPNEIVSNNGPPFTSKAIKQYFKQKGVKHRRIQPMWPQANAYAERFMASLNKISKATFIEKTDWKLGIYQFLFNYRNSPHSTTKVPPAEMMFQRKIKHLIPSFDHKIDQELHNKVNDNDAKSKQISTQYTDNRRHCIERKLQNGDLVIVKQRKANKLTPNFEPNPYRVTNQNHTMITAKDENSDKTITRNISHFKKLPESTKFPLQEEEIEDEVDTSSIPSQPLEQPSIPNQQPLQQSTTDRTQPVKKTYPKRNRRELSEWKMF